MFDIVFILLFGRLQPHKTADSSDTPVTFGSSAAGSAFNLFMHTHRTIILYGSISEAINSLPLIPVPNNLHVRLSGFCISKCCVPHPDPKYRQMIYWVLGILLGLI